MRETQLSLSNKIRTGYWNSQEALGKLRLNPIERENMSFRKRNTFTSIQDSWESNIQPKARGKKRDVRTSVGNTKTSTLELFCLNNSFPLFFNNCLEK